MDLTDAIIPAASPAPVNVVETQKAFKTVSQDIYDSWGLKKQLLYCYARDMENARYESTFNKDPEAARWYMKRAMTYLDDANKLPDDPVEHHPINMNNGRLFQLP